MHGECMKRYVKILVRNSLSTNYFNFSRMKDINVISMSNSGGIQKLCGILQEKKITTQKPKVFIFMGFYFCEGVSKLEKLYR